MKYHHTLLSITIITLFLVLVTSCFPPPLIPPAPPPEQWVNSCVDDPESCVISCQSDALFCAKEVNDYLTTKVKDDKFRFTTWSLFPKTLFPNTHPMENNIGTPMHGAFVTIYVNEIAKKYLEKLEEKIKRENITSIGEVKFPNGSIIVKQNFVKKPPLSQLKDKPWLTVMWKLDGYCHAVKKDGPPCSGGDWFWYLRRNKQFLQFDKVPAVGKAQAFCLDCHGPVQKADYSWKLFKRLKAMLPKTSTVQSESAATTNVAKFCNFNFQTQKIENGRKLPFGPIIPGDVAFNPSNVQHKQEMFNCLSWRSFVALNWPAQPGQRGKPDPSKKIADSGERVWESYREIFEIFQPDNPKWTLDNKKWNTKEHFDPVCKQAEMPNAKVLRMISKQRGSVLNETHQAFGNQFNSLADQNGKLTLYEVRVNRDEYHFFRKNGYANTGNYDVGGPLGQLKWSSLPLHFPDNIRGIEGEGAIEIKASWRQMCTEQSSCAKLKVDDLNKYYHRKATMFTPGRNGAEGSCKTVTVGLVGLHIGHKSFWAPQWVWSTFEHVDNAPTVGKPIKPFINGKTPYSYYNEKKIKIAKKAGLTNEMCSEQRPGIIPKPKNEENLLYNKYAAEGCTNLQIIANSHPGKAPDTEHGEAFTSAQVTRLDPITTSKLNGLYQKKLRAVGSVFQYYELVNTQWPLNGRNKANLKTTINMDICTNGNTDDCYQIKPAKLLLRNTTMETFQTAFKKEKGKYVEFSSGGCMQCHAGAGLDFSFAWTDGSEEIVPIK